MATDKCHQKRGTREHGRGKKAGRGAGLRGGRGNAGAVKHNRLRVLKEDPNYFGRYGFKRHAVCDVEIPINVIEIDQQADLLVKNGKAKKDGDAYVINLAELGYDKLLGTGTPKNALKLTVPKATESAIKKIEAAGGSVSVA